MLQFFRPAGLVQIALTLPVHKGEMFSLACPECQDQVQDSDFCTGTESLFFNLMQQNYCTWAELRVVFVFYLCLFIDFCQHALPLPPHSLNAASGCRTGGVCPKPQADFPPAQ